MSQNFSAIINDFATLFSYTWYRDFPLSPLHREWGKRADWTIHLGVTFRRVSDLMGYFGHFESGGRTDLVIRDNNGLPVAFCEWEWHCPYEEQFNELDKLSNCCKEENPGICVLFTYCETKQLDQQVKDMSERWNNSTPLLLIIMSFKKVKGGRSFQKMLYYQLIHGKRSFLREQVPTPWKRDGSRWQIKETPEK